MYQKRLKRRFLLTIPRREESLVCSPLASCETLPTLDMHTPLGVTAPSRECLPDSVMGLVCPECKEVWYLSLGLYRYLFQANYVADALMPGVINWLNARHVPCNTIMQAIPLTDEGKLAQEEKEEP